MKILFISELLMGRDSGAKNCTWSHLECLMNVCEEVSVIAIYRDRRIKEEDKERFSGCEKVVFIKAFENRIENYINILTLNGWCIGKKVRRQIIKVIAEEKYDVIFFDDSVMGKMNRMIKINDPSIRILTFYHDIKADLAIQWMKHGGIKDVPFNLGIMHNEKLATKYSDLCIVLNTRDMNQLYKHYQVQCDALLPISLKDDISLEKLERNRIRRADYNKIIITFIGVYYYPNVIGIRWFIENVFSSLGTNFFLRIVGNGMEEIIDEINMTPNIEVKGWVESLEDEYINADIIIAPIFEGGGMKVKTAEAIKYGKAFIGTSEALYGYIENIPKDILNNKIYECNDKQQFIEAIEKIADNSEMRKYNSDIRNIYLEHYSYEKMSEVLRTLVDKK